MHQVTLLHIASGRCLSRLLLLHVVPGGLLLGSQPKRRMFEVCVCQNYLNLLQLGSVVVDDPLPLAPSAPASSQKGTAFDVHPLAGISG